MVSGVGGGNTQFIVLHERKIIVCCCLCPKNYEFFDYEKNTRNAIFAFVAHKRRSGAWTCDGQSAEMHIFGYFGMKNWKLEIDVWWLAVETCRKWIFLLRFLVSVTSQIKLMMDQLSHLSLHFWLPFCIRSVFDSVIARDESFKKIFKIQTRRAPTVRPESSEY